MRAISLLSAALLILLLGGCVNTNITPPANEESPFRYVKLKQATPGHGLSDAERLQYYSMDEGIQYLPVDLLLSLKRPLPQPTNGGKNLGLYDELLLAKPERLGLYPNLLDPRALPIGITASVDQGYVPMAGLNCSTCHTSVLTYDERAFLVDADRPPSPSTGSSPRWCTRSSPPCSACRRAARYSSATRRVRSRKIV